MNWIALPWVTGYHIDKRTVREEKAGEGRVRRCWMDMEKYTEVCRHKAHWMVLLLLVVGLIVVPTTTGMAQAWGAIFGFGADYPGGTLKTVFEMQRGGEDATVRTYTIEIVPNGDAFDMVETIVSPRVIGEEVQSGLGPGGAAGTAGARYDEDEARQNIDLTPLSTLEERNVQLEPNQNYYLPDGARLVTGDWVDIAGIQVIMATFIHPSYPGQKVEMGFAEANKANLLLFPPYMVRYVDGEVDYRVELVEFQHEM